MRKVMVMIASMALFLCAGSTSGQSLLPEPGSAEEARLSAEEWKAVCAAVPRACLPGRHNTRFSFLDSINNGTGLVLKGLSAKEWKAACAALANLPVCRIAELEGLVREDWLKTKAGKICSRSFVWTREECGKLAAGRIEPGMTWRMVRASWGSPKTIYRSSGSGSEWVYGGMTSYGSRYSDPSGEFVYLFFENGILKSWGESKYR
jgi:hypothetical protein